MSYTLIFPETPGIGGSRSSGVEVRRLKEQNLQLKEENNLLQYKVEILLDMVNVCLCYIYNRATSFGLEASLDTFYIRVWQLFRCGT